MPYLRTLRLLLPAAALMACERAPKPPPSGTAAATSPPPAAPPSSAAASGWSPELGPVLLVEGQSPNDALVVVTGGTGGADTITEQEAIAIRSRAAVLLGHGEAMQVALLQAALPRGGTECAPWPVWEVQRAPGQPGNAPLAPWAVGFATEHGRVVQPLPIDSVESLSRADSAHLVAEVTRLASTIASGGASKFQGLPFTVGALWRFRAAPAVEGIAATLVRQLNQEARPLEERTFLIAERDSTRRDAPYELAFHERSEGNEETIESTYVLAGLHLPGSANASIVLTRDYGDGSAFSIVERDSPARWRVRWTSRRAKC